MISSLRMVIMLRKLSGRYRGLYFSKESFGEVRMDIDLRYTF